MNAPTAGAPSGFDRRLIAPLVAGAVLNPINSTILAVALVPIGAAFGAPPSQTAWLISGLYLATSVGQPVVGRLIDLVGPRRLFLPATALVGIAGVIGTLAPSLAALVVARVVLGVGTCAGLPAAMRLLRDEAERTGHDSPTGVLTVLAISTQTVAVIGPSFGGLLIGISGWRATFAVNIPLALVAFVLGWRRFPADRPHSPSRRTTDTGTDLDLPGMVLFASSLVALLLFLMDPHLHTAYLLGLALLAALLFGARERRHAAPFIDVRVLGRNLPLLLTYARALLAYVVSYSFIYGLTQWLEDDRALSASTTGLVMLPMFGVGIAVAAATGRREALRAKLVVAAAAQVIACALLLALDPHSPLWLILTVLVIVGVPQGLNSLALQNAVYRQAAAADVATGAGLLRTAGYLGAIIASAALGGFFGERASTSGLHELAVFLLVAGGGYLLLNVLDRSIARPAEPAESAASR